MSPVPVNDYPRTWSEFLDWFSSEDAGSVQPEHLDAYLDEFVFRFSRRTSSSRGMLFYRLMQQAVVTDPLKRSSGAKRIHLI